MIYRPIEDWSNFDAGLWWSSNPCEDVGPKNPRAKMGLDAFVAESLTQENRDFITQYWAVTSGKLNETSDVFQHFDNRNIVVSERIASVIEQFEPGMHDLVEIPNVWSLGSQQRVERKLLFLNVYQTARTVDLERSKISRGTIGNTGKEFLLLSSIAPETSVVYAGSDQGHHLWRDDKTQAAFMSQDLVEALQAAGVQGFNFMECTVVDP